MKYYMITLLTIFLAVGSAGVLAKDRDSHTERKGYSGRHDSGQSHHSRRHYDKHGYNRHYRQYQSHKRHNRHNDGRYAYNNFRWLWQGMGPNQLRKHYSVPYRDYSGHDYGHSKHRPKKYRYSHYPKHAGKRNRHTRQQF